MDSLSQREIIKLAAEAGAKAALEQIEVQNEKSRKSRHYRRLHNTRALLVNYRMLKEHIKYAVYDANQIVQEKAVDILDLMWEKNNNSANFVESIKRSVERTVIIMNHIDNMLDIYKKLCQMSEKSEDMRKWSTINAMYLDAEPMTVTQIAELEHVDRRTVYRDIEDAIEKISSLIFGVEGVTK